MTVASYSCWSSISERPWSCRSHNWHDQPVCRWITGQTRMTGKFYVMTGMHYQHSAIACFFNWQDWADGAKSAHLSVTPWQPASHLNLFGWLILLITMEYWQGQIHDRYRFLPSWSHNGFRHYIRHRPADSRLRNGRHPIHIVPQLSSPCLADPSILVDKKQTAEFIWHLADQKIIVNGIPSLFLPPQQAGVYFSSQSIPPDLTHLCVFQTQTAPYDPLYWPD